MSVALITVIALVIAAVTGLKIYLENREINKEQSTTFTPVTTHTVLPVEDKKEETVTVNEPAPTVPTINEVKAPITDKKVDAPAAPAPSKPKTGKKPFKKKAFKPKPAAK